MRQLTANEVEFVLECYPEDIPYHGNCSAIDAATEIWIQEELDSGNQWAWCQVRVIAKWKDFEGCDFLGRCSYESEEAFRAGLYFDNMKETALDLLNEHIERVAEQLDELYDEAIPAE